MRTPLVFPSMVSLVFSAWVAAAGMAGAAEPAPADNAAAPAAPEAAPPVASQATLKAVLEKELQKAPIVPPSPPAAAPPAPTPFGPGYDPTRPAPVAPQPTGRGFLAATVVGTGIAEVQELPGEAFFGVVLDAHVEAGSTTKMIDATVVAKLGDTNSSPLIAACVPLQENPTALSYREGATTGHWHIHVGQRTWFCGGRTARLAVRVGTGGFAITAGTEPWEGPLVLLFALESMAARQVVLPGLTVELPLLEQDADKAN